MKSLVPFGPVRRRRPRPRRVAGALGAVAVVALALSACLPPPTQDCLGHPPASAADYQTLFRLRSTYWEGADTTAVLNRPGWPTAWFFGDTFVGRVNPDGSAQPGSGFSNSSAMTEFGPCITTHLGWLGTSLFTHPTFPNPSDGTWYWPGGAVARGDGTMDVFLTRMQLTSGAPPLNFAPMSVAVARVNPDMSVQSITPVSGALTSGVYVDGNGNSSQEVRPYGSSVTTDGTYAYLYTFLPASFFGTPLRLDQYVARVPLAGSLTTGWQYSKCADVNIAADDPCTLRTWSTNPSDARPMDFTDSTRLEGPQAAFHVARYGTGYLAIAKLSDASQSTDPAVHRVHAWTANSPAGPWTKVSTTGEIGTAMPPSAAGAFTYGAQLLSTPSAGLVLMWNSNASSAAVDNNIRLYGPQFATPTGLPPI